ncbi:MAG: hypothetical protein HN742_38890 [Lentisphaerae bacterium]|jgi:hypothetical protein|nr:hypothetical protein [Lentisphaerota bacterium]MBT4820555.1 hypothetical protein [Lentisphaerota bacterium]MBT5604608.1 hypothetical protein [Lentisphaerota bacterium]MBT7055922.1 hypothetical protein [Lentisphaerota bacterium]MBT7847898.1 hypothetical protein [Lentisphaerota bacterium]
MGSEEVIALTAEHGGPLVVRDCTGQEQPGEVSLPVALREGHRPRFVRLQVACGADQSDRVMVRWDESTLGEISAYLAEERLIEMELPVPGDARFGAGEHSLAFFFERTDAGPMGLTVRALVVPADDEEPSWVHRETAAAQYYNVTCHADFAWGYPRTWHEQRYVEAIVGALDIMREHPTYCFQLETKLQQLDPFFDWARRNDPSRIEELKGRIAEGRMEVICALSNPRISEVYGETLVRNMVLGRRFVQELVPGYRQAVYDAVDVMPGCSQIPQLCVLGGYRYYVFTRPMGRQVIFHWRGLDGSTIIATRSGYSVGHDQGRLTPACATLYHPPVERVMVGGDDQVPNSRVAEESETWDPSTRRLSTLTAYLDAASAFRGQFDTLGPVLDSLSVVFTGGLQGEHNLYLRNNCLEDLLLACETAELALGHERTAALPGPSLDVLWSEMLANTGHAMCHVLAEDFEERSQAISSTESAIRERQASTLKVLAAGVPCRVLGTAPVVVANRLGWPRTEVVNIEAPRGGEWRVTTPAGGVIPGQLLDAGRLAFLAEHVPAAGHTVFHLASGSGGPCAPELSASVK